MSDIEVVIILLLLFMIVPDVCRKMGRPVLAYAVFIVFGLLLGPFANAQVAAMLMGAGKIGFVLLLFEVGLEIDLPPLGEMARPLAFAVPWALAQYPVILLAARLARLDLATSLVSAAALTGCSVGLGYAAWKNFPGLNPGERPFVLRVMVTLEMLAIVLLAVGTPAIRTGLDGIVLLKLGGVLAVVVLVARFAKRVVGLFGTILQHATHWRTHLLVLIVLTICALGERLGLSAAKTAFFLGLFMSRVEHEGKGLEEFMAPVSRRLLIPMLFVSLGLTVPWRMLGSWTAALALGTAALLLGVRETFQRRWFKLGEDRKAFLLLCPNLTVVALGATAMMDAGRATPEKAAWLLLTGLFLSVAAVALLPRGE